MSEKIELPEVVREWPQYMQRVWVEKQEWDKRVKTFGVSIGHSPLFAALDAIEQELLKEQYEIMWQYSEVLGKRVDHFCKAPSDDVLKKLNDDFGVAFVLPEFTPAIEKLMADNDTVRELLVYPVAPAVIATESMKDEPEDFYPATSSGISRTPNQALGELAGSVKRLVGHFKETRNAPKLFNVQDSERPAFVIAHSFEEALDKWKVAVAEENATDSKYEEVPPAGIMHVCDGNELIIERGFADKGNL